MTDRAFSLRFYVFALAALVLSLVPALILARTTATERANDEIGAQATLISSLLAPHVRPDGRITSRARGDLLESFRSSDLLLVRITDRSRRVVLEGAKGVETRETTHDKGLLAALRGGHPHTRDRLVRPDGSTVSAIEAVAPVRVDGRIVGALELYRPWGPVAAEIRRDMLLRGVSIAAALLVLYAALFPILRRLLRERRYADDARRDGERLADAIVQHADEGIWVLNADGTIRFVNPKLQQLLGYDADHMLGRDIADFTLVPPAESGRQELLLRRSDGSFVWTLVSTHALAAGGGSVAIVADIDELKGTEESLHGATRRLSALVHAQRAIAERELNPDEALDTVVEQAQALVGADGAFLYLVDGDHAVIRAASGEASSLVGVEVPLESGLTGMCIRTGAVQVTNDVPNDPRVSPRVRETFTLRSSVLVPLPGDPFRTAVLGIAFRKPNAVTDEAIETTRLMAEFAAVALRNVAERRAKQELLDALADSEERFRNAIESSPIGFALCTPDDRYLVVNEAYCRIVGRTREELESLTWRDLTHPDDLAAELVPAERLVAGAVPHLAIEKRLLRGDGETIWGRMLVSMVFGADGTAAYGVAQLQDITEQRLLEQSVLERERLFRAVYEQNFDATILFDDEGLIVEGNNRAAQLVGRPKADLPGMHLADFATTGVDRWRELLAEGHGEIQIQTATGRRRTIVFSARADVQPGRHLAVIDDVTDQRALEERVRQGQKLEAIGRLAGGVAHDFNNMLTAISGYDELLLGRLDPGSELHAYANEIREAAQRAAGLTRQLLAFSRRQVLQPSVLDLNAVVESTRNMITRLIGEQVHLETFLDPATEPVLADEGQLEQVIVNLAVNARDAMPSGGRLRIETTTADVVAAPDDEVPTGRYSILTMRDEGLGMDREQLARLFEPFYSTKEELGVGLGLATAYGVVSQSGGYIRVESEPGSGACFRIFLPVSRREAPEAPATADEGSAPAGSETVLLVEDEPSVRSVLAEMLTGNGYVVITAADGREAVDVAAGHDGSIELLVTDVVMPGMSGQDVAGQIAADRPGMKTLFVSGYNDTAIRQHGVLAPGTAFLQKPFTAGDLARKAREILDGVAV